MSLILHLSDLHLSTRPTDDQIIGDHKVGILPPGDQPNRSGLLENTLRELGHRLKSEGKPLSAIVISGDITVQCHEDGFQRLPRVLKALGRAYPGDDRVVAVPGNHDVQWRSEHGARERYAYFLKHCRAQGYVTPWLDGIDARVQPHSRASSRHYLLDEEAGWLIVPMNSSNYCGTLQWIPGYDEAFWNRLPEQMKQLDAKLNSEDFSKKLDALRLHDVARVSEWQLRQLRDMLNALLGTSRSSRGGRSRRLRPQGDDLLRIATLHHHLLPVSANEEMKTFESITNLGLLRRFLSDQHISLVLHGHKHTEYVYRDHVYPEEPRQPPRVISVISGATLGFWGTEQRIVGRLLEIQHARRAPRVVISNLAPAHSGTALRTGERRSLDLWDDESTGVAVAGPHVIRAGTVAQAYARLLTRFTEERVTAILDNVVCQVMDPSTADHLPPDYPPPPDHSGPRSEWLKKDGQDWLDSVLKWWQQRDSKLLDRLNFTHGNRIFKYTHSTDGSQKPLDQLKEAIKLLGHDEESGRAVITLLKPSEDLPNGNERKFPAFCSLQFFLEGNSNPYRLGAIAYFRKQEMRYWWPVNIAEIASLQKKAIEHLNLGGKYAGIVPGSITTFAALAYAAKSRPRVAVPLVDRMLDQESTSLWSMAYALCTPSMKNRNKWLERWEEVLTNLTPEKETDRDGVPIAVHGLNYLIEQITLFESHQSARKLRQQLQDVVEALNNLKRLNAEYASETADGDIDPDRYAKWRTDVVRLVGRLRELVTSFFRPRQPR
jgi:3',5'-cyclic AMP phosphodiesterase CpdA